MMAALASATEEGGGVGDGGRGGGGEGESLEEDADEAEKWRRRRRRWERRAKLVARRESVARGLAIRGGRRSSKCLALVEAIF